LYGLFYREEVKSLPPHLKIRLAFIWQAFYIKKESDGIMNCTIEQFEDVVAKFKYFAESVNIELSSEAEGLRQELVVICAELLVTVREEIEAGADSVV